MINCDRVNLVNDNDQIVGEADKFDAHLGKGLLHQAVSLFLFKRGVDANFELLMQQRSPKKIVGAKQWANTLCGNVAVGENHLACVIRRLNDELGVVLDKNLEERILEFHVLNYATACNEKYSEREIDHLFILLLDDADLPKLNLNANADEVTDTDWCNWQKLTKQLACKNKELTPWFKIFLEDKAVVEKINQILQKGSCGR